MKYLDLFARLFIVTGIILFRGAPLGLYQAFKYLYIDTLNRWQEDYKDD